MKVTDRHTAIDYAHTLRDLSDVHFPDAAKIVLVQDNLNTHKPASLYEAFPAAEARRLVERFEWHYTSKHCSGAQRIERPPFNRVMISRAKRSRGLLGDRKVYGGAFRLTSIELPRCCR